MSNKNDTDKRFHETRKAGHSGWINQDGDAPTTDNTDPQTLAIYQRAADSFARHRG